MTSPRNATTGRGGKRFYSWRDENYWSVTTIVDGGIPKKALIYWSANEVAAYVCDNLDSVIPIIRSDRDAAYDFLKRTPWRKKEKAADLGKSIHAASEAHALGKPFPKWSPIVKPYMDGYVQFLQDFRPVIVATEASVFNKTERYAGTLDAIIETALPFHETPGKYILDTKSGKGIWPEIGLQLSAYRNAEFIGLPDGSETAMPKVDGALGLHLTPEGYHLYEIRVDEEVYRAFLYAREVFRFLESTSKTVIGLEYTHAVQTVETDMTDINGNPISFVPEAAA